MGPKGFVLVFVLVGKVEMKQREGIGQLEERIAFRLAERDIGADKAAFLQLFHGLGELQVVVQLSQFKHLFSGQAFGFCGHGRDDSDMVTCLFEKGTIKVLELVLQLTVGGKKQPVDVLGHTLFWTHQRVVIGHATHHHVALGDFLLAVAEAVCLEIALALVERERSNVNLVRLAVMESTSVVDDVVNHPRGGRAANDEFDVVARRGPTVPKPFQCGDEFGTNGASRRLQGTFQYCTIGNQYHQLCFVYRMSPVCHSKPPVSLVLSFPPL